MGGDTVTRAMTIEEQADAAHRMASLLRRIVGVEDEAKERAKEYREEIQALEAELRALGLKVDAGVEESAQMDLFSQDEAQRALHGVAAAACSCEGGPESEVKSPACPVHGVGSPAVAEHLEAQREEHADAQLAEDVAATAAALREEIGEPVDVGTVEEPPSVAAFRAKRRKRA